MRRISRGLPEEELSAIRTELNYFHAELSLKLQRLLQSIQNVFDYILHRNPRTKHQTLGTKHLFLPVPVRILALPLPRVLAHLLDTALRLPAKLLRRK